jgi:hypothetical protein
MRVIFAKISSIFEITIFSILFIYLIKLASITGKTLEGEQAALVAIRRIEEESHTSGLTDRITQMLKKNKPAEEENKNE